jgi:preprotein translocase subunit SecG
VILNAERPLPVAFFLTRDCFSGREVPRSAGDLGMTNFTISRIYGYSPLPKMDIFINVLLAINLLVAVLMALVILMQRPKSEGLGAAFGGGVTENIFGAQTTNVLVKFTGWLAGIFFVLTFVLSVLYAQRSSSDSALHKELMGMPTPAATATASPAAATGAPAAAAAPRAATSPAANVSPAATARPSGVTASVASSPSAAPSASP